MPLIAQKEGLQRMKTSRHLCFANHFLRGKRGGIGSDMVQLVRPAPLRIPWQKTGHDFFVQHCFKGCFVGSRLPVFEQQEQLLVHFEHRSG